MFFRALYYGLSAPKPTTKIKYRCGTSLFFSYQHAAQRSCLHSPFFFSSRFEIRAYKKCHEVLSTDLFLPDIDFLSVLSLSPGCIFVTPSITFALQDNPYAKFLGACNDYKYLVDKCLRTMSSRHKHAVRCLAEQRFFPIILLATRSANASTTFA